MRHVNSPNIATRPNNLILSANTIQTLAIAKRHAYHVYAVFYAGIFKLWQFYEK